MREKKSLLLLTMLLVMALSACGPSPEEVAATETQAAEYEAATQTALAPTATPTPTPSPASLVPLYDNLYLAQDNLLLTSPMSNYVTTTHFLSSGSSTSEWRYEVAGDSFAGTFAYTFVMASAGTTTIDVEIAVVAGGEETVIADDSYTMDSEYYRPYRGEMTPTSTSLSSGDEVVLRITATGDNYGTRMGGLSSFLSVFEAQGVNDGVLAQRTEAFEWMLDNIGVGEDILTTDLFLNFRDQLDFLLLEGDNGRWIIGWGLTVSGAPYQLDWDNEMFSVQEITQEESLAYENDEMQVSLEINP